MKSAHESNRFRGHRKERMLAGESIFHVVAAAESSRWNARFCSIELPRTSALFNRTPVKSLNEILRLSSPACGKAHARFSGFSYSAYPISRLACFLSFVSLFPLHFFYFFVQPFSPRFCPSFHFRSSYMAAYLLHGTLVLIYFFIITRWFAHSILPIFFKKETWEERPDEDFRANLRVATPRLNGLRNIFSAFMESDIY